MSFVYLTNEPPEEFPSPDSNFPPVLLNTHTQKFCLIAQPSLQELHLAIEQYGNVRLEAHWKALLEPLTHTPTRIRFFQSHGPKLPMVEHPSVWRHFNVSSTTQLSKRLMGVSISEQRELVSPLKPKSVSEMLALYKDTKTVDMTGYRYLVKVLDSSKSAFEFFGTLVDALFLQMEQSDHAVGHPEVWMHQARVFEFLGTAVQKKWLLFPFAHHSSGLWEHRALHHWVNVNCYFNQDYRPTDAMELIDSIQSVFTPKTTHAGALGHLRSLIVASTYRTAEQTSTSLLARCHSKMSEAVRAMSVQTANMAKRTYNHLVKIHNSKVDARFAQTLLTNAKEAASLEDFSSFQYLLEVDQKWAQWALLFEGFVQSTADSLGQVRKTACRDFADFLLSLENAPTQPHHLLRHHINDYADGSGTFRKWLQGKFDSPAVRNLRLQQASQLFEFLLDRLLKERRDPEEPVPRFQNPVDMRMDRFSETYKGGTHRKAIRADIMETMRNILVEDDYAWSKANTTYNWVHLIDATTGTLEYVWCPSSTIAMFTLLSVPLRGLQGRLLDSGEGDAMVYDFDTDRMVPNQNQLPVSGQLDPNRSEGVLQVMASGMLGVTDFVGMWIGTNKTSDTGYPIPWINEDLMKHLRYQREWIARYSPGPEMYGISDAQGHRNAPTEWKGLEKKFYCLFRDPAAERSASLSLPVSKQKIYKLWNDLCSEAERRINSEARNTSERVILIKPESGDTGSPKALHDIHTLRVSGITDLLNRGVPLHIVSEYVAGHATYMMTLWYDKMPAGLVRDFLVKCKAEAGNSTSPLPKFTEEELKDLSPFLMCNPKYEGVYTGFDALEENKGLAIIRQSGICPGTRCEEGGLDDNGRVAPVPMGDRGPSCPQCRFWLTGPAFLLGQVIEGNQLIFKIRKKIELLAKLRERTMDAEDSANEELAALLRGQTDVEERQLNDMLTEWWHRIRFFESSVLKLDEFIQTQRSKEHPESDHAGHRVILIKEASEQKVDYGFAKSTELELKHFLSTCAEILPEYSVDCSSAPQDIELAVGKFLAINDESEMATMLFKLNEEQRLTAANLTIEVLLSTLGNPNQVEEILEGRPLLEALPGVRQDLAKMFAKGISPSLTESPKKVRLKKGLS